MNTHTNVQYGQTGISGSQFIGSASDEVVQNTAGGDKETLINTGTGTALIGFLALSITLLGAFLYKKRGNK